MNTLWIDHKYVNLASSHLALFKRKDRNLYNMRCPFCGDSAKNKTKARGYLFEKEGKLIYRCHNCGLGLSLKNFLRNIDSILEHEYNLEVFKESKNTVEDPDSKFVTDITKFAKRRIDKFDIFKSMKKISQLEHDHPAKKYVLSRKIPTEAHYRLYYCPRFCSWVNSHMPGKFNAETLKYDAPRLIMPFIDESGYVFGYQGRSFDKSDKLRYISIMLDDTREKVFGLESVDTTQQLYVVEGPIDSFFVKNCIAMAGSDSSYTDRLDRSKVIYVYDNEPRNLEIVSRIDKAIDKGYNVVIWPDSMEVKDINDMIMSGMTVYDVQYIIDKNTFSGLSARLRLNTWKRVNDAEVGNKSRRRG